MGSSSKLICMNRSCGTANSREWKRGWPLRSGGFALLCCPCGSAYENSVFCNTFHFAESGWRECGICGKHLHCGCIASACSLELLDYGGIGCTTCWNTSRLSSIQGHGLHNAFGTSSLNIAGDQQSTHAQNSEVGNSADERELVQLCNLMKANEPNFMPHSQRRDPDSSVDHTNGDEVRTVVEIASGLTNATQPSTKLPITEAKDMHDSQTDPSMSITLGTSLGTSHCVPGRRFQFHPYLPQTPKVAPATCSEVDKGYMKQVRVARPPGYGRGRNQLLPRYWPRITDQELQQLAGDMNSTIVPLFEKVLSASDAGRIGRLVLPKACAETYFPPISQSEGLPLHIQDVKGKEWTFQFRFWPNNNSRMYVLEGVTPCIQSMQLQAGDTVTFSRIDPGGKLVMGFRKSSNSDSQCSLLPNGSPSGDASISGVTENFPTVGSFSSYSQTHKESKDPRVSNLNLSDTDIARSKTSEHGGRTTEDSTQQPVLIADKKRTRNIGAKTKRLLMHSEDAMELRLTWEEAQDLLRPPPSVKPVIVSIEGREFEEYNEPPVFGKKTIFTAQSSGEQEQWAQCDDCLKWRRLPVDVLLPPTWTCSDNVWDPNRCSCFVPDDMCAKELDNLLRENKDMKRRRILETHKPDWDHEPSGLDALASVAVLGDHPREGDCGDPSIGATTKHPRHRPGCTCIVCIQPPSGQGKHEATCTCNVCMTVKRRFKTLMLRKKKRQFEREAEHSQALKNRIAESETNGSSPALMHTNSLESEVSQYRRQVEVAETGTGQIDLNCDPSCEDTQVEEPEGSSVNLVQAAAALPLENYVKHNGFRSLECEQQGRPIPHIPPSSAGVGERCLAGDGQVAPLVQEVQEKLGEGYHKRSSD